MKKKNKFIIGMLVGVVLLSVVSLLPNAWMVSTYSKKVLTLDEGKQQHADCALILGAGVRNSKPTPMLRDRLLTGIALYQSGAVDKLLMSGDHGREEYDEVGIMKDFAVEQGVPDSDIFMDHAGFSTYESVYRAKEIFEANDVIIVTQTYHLYRALYDADKLDVSAVGVSADLQSYYGQFKRDVREILARDKDFFWCLWKPKPTYLGEKIPVSGDGNQTNDN